MARTLSFTASTRLHFHRTCEVELSEKLSTGLADALPLAADAPPLMQRLPSVLPERPCRVSRVPLLMPLVWWLSVDPQFVACKD